MKSALWHEKPVELLFLVSAICDVLSNSIVEKDYILRHQGYVLPQ